MPKFETRFDAAPSTALPPPVASDLARLPACDTWVNLRDLGAKGDGQTDDTAVLQKAIEEHRAIYLPSGFYVVRDTLKLKSDTVLIGLHPGATQIILPDGTPAYQGIGAPKALLEAPTGGSNIVIGVGLYTGGNNRRAVAALWKAGANSMMNDVRFLGGHGTPLPDGSRQRPYNESHSADPDPSRHWDGQYPSLLGHRRWRRAEHFWIFGRLRLLPRRGWWFPTPRRRGALTRFRASITSVTKCRCATRRTGVSTRCKRKRSGAKAVSVCRLKLIRHTTSSFANFHSYRVISSYQPFPWAVKVSNSRDIHLRNFHCDSNSKASFDAAVYDQTHNLEIRQHEFAWLDISGQATAAAGCQIHRWSHAARRWKNWRADFSTSPAAQSGRTAISISWTRICSGSIAGTRRVGAISTVSESPWNRSTWP